MIVSTGAAETPKLLMLSGIGDSKQLNKFGIPVIANLFLQDQIFLELKFFMQDKALDIKYPNVEKHMKSKTGNLAKIHLYISWIFHHFLSMEMIQK